jgi:hypothetical protein
MPTMTKKRRVGRPKTGRPTRDSIISFRVTPEFEKWFDGLVEHSRIDANWAHLPPTAVIVQALICLAKERGYEIEPPKL